MYGNYQILAGITKENELYFLELEFKEKNYFSMMGFTIEPISIEDAKERAEEYLEDGEYWKMAVESDSTTESKEDYNKMIIEIDGWEGVLDNSLYTEEVEVEGKDYGFISQACGQHEENELNHYFIPKKTFNSLMKLWKNFHLKKLIPKEFAKSGINKFELENIKSNEDKNVKEAIRIITN